jgi:regulator of RNase E activity RraA
MSKIDDVVPGMRVFQRVNRPDATILKQLENIGVGDLADCMHGIGAADGGIRQVYTPMARIYGPAVTVDLTPGDGLLLRAAIAAAKPGDVIVATSHGVTARALLGGAVGMHMVQRGIKGLIVDGAVRDVAEFRSLDLPVMARAVTPRSGTSSAGWGDVNVPIACGGVVVMPGDIIVGDDEGLVVVPRRSAAAVARQLGKTGHAVYDPDNIRKRLAELAPDAPLPSADNLRKAFADRGGIVEDRAYDDPA